MAGDKKAWVAGVAISLESIKRRLKVPFLIPAIPLSSASAKPVQLAYFGQYNS